MWCSFFFFNDTATTEIYTLSLHDALPICVTDADLALRQRRGGQRLDQVRELPGALVPDDDPAVDERDPRGVVAPVLQPSQPVDDDPLGRPAADVPHDPAHAAECRSGAPASRGAEAQRHQAQRHRTGRPRATMRPWPHPPPPRRRTQPPIDQPPTDPPPTAPPRRTSSSSATPGPLSAPGPRSRCPPTRSSGCAASAPVSTSRRSPRSTCRCPGC